MTSERRHQLIPGGCHTYSKGDKNFPPGAPVLYAGSGGRVLDAQGRSFVDWGMGINNVLIGHAEPAIDEPAVGALRHGQAFCRPALLEEKAAEAVLELYANGRDHLMIKFAKSGSDANNAAIRLARAVTGRQHIAFDATAPFLSTADWFCSAQPKWRGTLDAELAFAHGFRFNDIDSLVQVFAGRPLACVILEVCRFERPTQAFVHTLQELCRSHGTLLVVDEVVTGYRFGQRGAATLFGLEPDLFTLGKGMANGYSVAALLGRREYMARGADDVFLLSTTNGAESSGLAAAIATAAFYQEHDVISGLINCGRVLERHVAEVSEEFHLAIRMEGEFASRQRLMMPEAWRRTFHTTLLQQGVLWPYSWTCPCYRRTAEELEVTRRALVEACRAVIPVIHGKVLSA